MHSSVFMWNKKPHSPGTSVAHSPKGSFTYLGRPENNILWRINFNRRAHSNVDFICGFRRREVLNSSAEAKSWLPQIQRQSGYRNNCGTVGDNTGHGLPPTMNRDLVPAWCEIFNFEAISGKIMVQQHTYCELCLLKLETLKLPNSV